MAARDALLPAEPADAIRDDRGWEPVNWETDCRPSGEYRLVVFMDGVGRVTGQGGGYEIVPDPDHRLPQPGLRQEAGSAAPAGAPEPAATRFRACLQRRAAILEHPEELPPPVAALDDGRDRLGRGAGALRPAEPRGPRRRACRMAGITSLL